MGDNLCGCGSVLVCVVRGVERENVEGKNNFMFVGKVVRQSKTKGVLIKVVWSKQNGERKLYKIVQNRIDFVDKLNESGVCVSLGTG